MKILGGIYPAVITSYSAGERFCTIKVEGITDGAESELIAELAYPLGDKSVDRIHPTEIEILAGDLVWVMFVSGDSRFPIVVNYRNPQVGNQVGWREWHHQNIRLHADDTIILRADHVKIISKTLTHNDVNVGYNHIHYEPDGTTSTPTEYPGSGEPPASSSEKNP